VCDGGVSRNLGVETGASYLSRYGIRDVLALNDGKGGFDDAGAAAGPYFQRALIGRGSAAGDIDNDGDIDLVVNNLAGPAVVLRNDDPHGNWITLTFATASGNRDAINTLIRVTAGRTSELARRRRSTASRSPGPTASNRRSPTSSPTSSSPSPSEGNSHHTSLAYRSGGWTPYHP